MTLRPATATELHNLVACLRGFKPSIQGGMARRLKLKPEHFNMDQLAIGATVELEHTTDRCVAIEIAMAHLHEDKSYYAKLEKMERRSPRS